MAGGIEKLMPVSDVALVEGLERRAAAITRWSGIFGTVSVSASSTSAQAPSVSASGAIGRRPAFF
jgi:hypothetical protein